MNYLKFYDDESYLLNEVGPHFQTTGELAPADFYMILIWKANRAKNYHRDRLKAMADGSFAAATELLAMSLYACPGEKECLGVLMSGWGFYLATASAILTILYPEEFTVYDYRVVGGVGFKDLSQRSFSDSLWADYEAFRELVKSSTPHGLSLRDKD